MTGIDHAELLAYILERLNDDLAESDNDDRLNKWLATASPADITRWRIMCDYEPAKRSARRGDFGPLLKILTAFDPELADLITGKRQKRVRRSPVKTFIKAIEYRDRRDRADAIKRIRELIEEKIEARPSRELVVEVAAKVLKSEPEEISKIIHRGKP
jgi:hypothetical protein